MSLIQLAYLIEHYGLRLNMDQLAQVLGIEKQTVMHRVSKGALGIPTYVDGKHRYADARDVAAYFDSMRAAAA
jgi:DNA-directed RNA polymerase specialized sigma24 family protein